jgi:hypothetical protein
VLLPTCSRADLPAELYELMAAMTREGRTIPAEAMATDQHGCTILGAWVKRRLDQAAGMQQGGLAGSINDRPVQGLLSARCMIQPVCHPACEH